MQTSTKTKQQRVNGCRITNIRSYTKGKSTHHDIHNHEILKCKKKTESYT